MSDFDWFGGTYAWGRVNAVSDAGAPAGVRRRILVGDPRRQLINVLKGEMTLVGPRPLWPDEIDLVDSGVVRAWIQVRPGLTWPRASRRRPPPTVSLDD
jgi:hypothetical protein